MPKTWISRYDSGVSSSFNYPEWTVPDLLRHSADRFPDSPALLFYGTCISYRELDDLTTRFARGLRHLGVSQGDRVAIMLPNIPQAVIAYYGILKAGAVVVPTNPLYVEREIQTQLTDAGGKTMVVLDLLYSRVRAVKEATTLPERIIVTGVQDYLPFFKKLFYPIKAWFAKRWVSVEKAPCVYDFLGLLHIDSTVNSTDHFADLPLVRPIDLAQLQYTGGTTGTPKGVMLTHHNVVVNTLQGRYWSPDFREGQEIFLGAIPFFHCYGLATCQNLAIATGCPIVLLPRFHADEVIKVIHAHRITMFSGVPMMYSMIVEHPDVSRYDLRSLRVCLSGASPLPADVQGRFENLTGARISEGYGLTEAGPTTHCNPLLGEHPPSSMGLPFPDTEARVVDPDTGLEEVPEGETGELIVRGPQIMLGYWNKEDETRAVLRDGWLYTGDLVRRDDRGYFYFVDRKKDIIKSRGETVYPREIEEVLRQHPAVSDAAVVGVADHDYGEIIKAYVVAKPESHVTEETLITHCAGLLARYKIPSSIEFRHELPRTVIGKVLRRAMRAEAAHANAEEQLQRQAV
ncbi:MAG: long-chain fatty acid--CoA ligase [Nitrospira sp. SG-bin1]|nr:MAG: long-chain fatty acid--CoA ligase [Nitrospira sp. SG-bin1]